MDCRQGIVSRGSADSVASRSRPGQLTGGCGTREDREHIAGVVVDEIRHPCFGTVTERNLGGVDLP